MTKLAIDANELASLIRDAKGNGPISPVRFAAQLMYDLRDLEGWAKVERLQADINPTNAQLQAYMRRSLEVMSVLLELGFTPENALFWFRCFPAPELESKPPVEALSADCTAQVVQSLKRIFDLGRNDFGPLYEKMREDTQAVQEDIFRDMRMLSAEEAAHAMSIDGAGMSSLDIARKIESTRRAIYIMAGREPWFPACQFDSSGPKPIVADLIKTLSPYRSSGDIVAWLWGANGWLDGDSPMDVLDTEPKLVLDAAFQDVVEEIEANDAQR